ncbi:Hemolysin-type calcium-binding region [Roseobacter sp. AzwK-3b]|uniref:vanadium-dependent haloperoxidase n=1 Tax=Roseobacter sp. AzwK-3b TaxID=351016 RepID=UPI0001569E00|nr:vanadium-dependent haloperoxidase [Roseobacter sp. AzwK-3b]EDM72831.1 Hemolysin-type calcium-binding region [Roseobacter sp. AzwK-3b]
MSDDRFQISFTQDGETRVITLEGRREDYDFEYEDGELEIEAREGDFEWEFEDVESFEFLSFDSEKDPVDQGESSPEPGRVATLSGPLHVSFTQDGETRVITLEGRREDYDFEYEDGELEIEAREGDFEWEFEDVESFEFLSFDSEKDPVDPGESSPEPGRVATLSGPLHDFDFLLQDGALAVRNRFDGEVESLSEFDSFIAGAETFRTADILAQLEQPGPDLLAEGGPRLMMVNTPEATPSVIWDQILQSIIVESGGGPTNAARSLSIMHTAIYDAQASYDPVAQRVSIDLEGDNLDIASLSDSSSAEIETAMHVAAHHVLSELYPQYQEKFDQVLSQRLGLDVSDDSRAYEVGIDAAQDGLTPRQAEAAQLAAQSDGLYTPVNSDPAPETRKDIARWTPEKQGILSPTPEALQTFLTPELSLAEGFALPETPTGDTDTALTRPDGPEPFFTPEHVDTVLDFHARTITLAAPAEINGVAVEAGTTISVDKSLIGPVISPAFIAQAEAIVQTSATLTEDQKMVAEFWEDGPGTSFPPGAWMTLTQYVSQRDEHDAATDALLFMTMGNAMFDAAIATWDAKVFFDYARPVTAIRDLGHLGLIGEPGVDDLTGEPGYVIQAFGGIDPNTGTSLGTRTIPAENFITYQLPGGEQSPPFAEYTSGHSTFSAAGAAVLQAFTGSDNLDAHITVPPQTSAFDVALPGDVYQFQWDTFSEAAIDGGASRIYGGIHFSDGNVDGLSAGATIGADAYALAVDFANGTAQPEQQPFFDEFFIA